MDCGNPPGLRISGALTVAVWVRAYPQSKNQHVVSKYGWQIYLNRGTIPQMAVCNAVGKGYIDMPATQPIVPGEWNLIVAVHDPAMRQIRLFINGRPAGEMTKNDDKIGRNVNSHRLLFGRYAHWRPTFNGLIGGVMIWSGALSAERIADLCRERPDDALPFRHRLAVTARRYCRAKKLTFRALNGKTTGACGMPRSPLAESCRTSRFPI